mgnify:CR=1 FL=1
MTEIASLKPDQSTRRTSAFRLALRRAFSNPLTIIGGVFVAITVGCALFAPWIALTDPVMDANLMNAELPPSWEFPFGTDAQGRPEIRRFLTGPFGCEITGSAMTPDRRTFFVNVQHPGEDGGSTWPHDDGYETPRSATLVITKDDGGVIGT